MPENIFKNEQEIEDSEKILYELEEKLKKIRENQSYVQYKYEVFKEECKEKYFGYYNCEIIKNSYMDADYCILKQALEIEELRRFKQIWKLKKSRLLLEEEEIIQQIKLEILEVEEKKLDNLFQTGKISEEELKRQYQLKNSSIKYWITFYSDKKISDIKTQIKKEYEDLYSIDYHIEIIETKLKQKEVKNIEKIEPIIIKSLYPKKSDTICFKNDDN